MTDNERLIKLRKLRNNLITLGISDEVNNLEEMFPELKMDSMNEDENIKNELFKHLKEGAEGYEPAGSSEDYAKWLDWLEKQFKQIHYTSDAPIGQTATGEVVYIEDIKSTKSKFERGCWITNGRYVKLVVGIGTKGDIPYYYMFKDGTTKYIDEIDKKYHLWTIDDVKDGDIIAFNIDENLKHKWIGIFKERPDENLYDNKYCTCKFHCLINFINEEPEFDIGGIWNIDITDVQPATKEQCDTLFAKIKEESLMWDDVNKVLIVVKQTKKNLQDNSFRRMFEQKSIKWSEKDEKMLNDIISDVKFEGYNNDMQASSYRKINWLNSLKDNIKFNYSKDDKMLDKIIQIVSNYWNSIPDSNIDENEEVESCYNWLKSLR